VECAHTCVWGGGGLLGFLSRSLHAPPLPMHACMHARAGRFSAGSESRLYCELLGFSLGLGDATLSQRACSTTSDAMRRHAQLLCLPLVCPAGRARRCARTYACALSS
jgi:hypothetical protein